MGLLVEAVERSGGDLSQEFPINPFDLQEILDRFGNPADWTRPIVLLHDPEMLVAMVEKEKPQFTRKPYEFPSGYVVPPDVAAGKLGRRERRVSTPGDLWGNLETSPADSNDLVRVTRMLKTEVLLATTIESDPVLDGTAVFLEPYKGSYLDRDDMHGEETTAAITFFEEAPFGISQIPTERKGQLSGFYRAIPLAPDRVYFQGVVHFQNTEGMGARFELIDRNIVTGKAGVVDTKKQLHDAKRFFTEPHPTHPETTPFIRLIRKGRPPR